MEYLLSADLMREIDNYTSETIGIPSVVLMERAALGCVDICLDRLGKLGLNRISFLCGYGNNGGDGLALARLLFLKGVEVNVILIGDESKVSELNLLHQKILEFYGVSIDRVAVGDAIKVLEKQDGDVFVDAIFGIGLSRELSDEYVDLFAYINNKKRYVFALDVPSGLTPANALSGKVIASDITFSFGFLKLDTLLYPMAKYCGELIRVEMGIDERSIFNNKPSTIRYTSIDDVVIPNRDKGANKGTYKKLLIIAGSEEVYGALALCCRSAFASGIGMIKVITHVDNKHSLEETLPEVMSSYYDKNISEKELTDLFVKWENWADGILIGPGIGFGSAAKQLVDLSVNKSTKPILVDADAIRIIGQNENLKNSLGTDKRKCIITPHVGEFSAFINKTINDIKLDQVGIVKAVADSLNITIIYKDATSIIASHMDERIFVNCSGTDGMATAGSGDVLAGLCSVFMVQLGNELEAASSAAYIHGLAGCIAEEKNGTRAMTAVNIIDSFKDIFK